MTLMSVTVAVMSTLVALLLIFVSVRIGKWSTRRWKGRRTMVESKAQKTEMDAMGDSNG
jgi:hypothetical protein